MSKTRNRERGDVGEIIAARFLEKRGHHIVGQNYLRPWGEIDLISKNGPTLHFVEVKTVSRENVTRETIRPEENIHPNKLKRLERAIQSYLWEKRCSEVPWQLDAVCVSLDVTAKKAFVELFESISI